jgi:hypothetical protein
MTTLFTPDDAIVAADEDTGDVVIWAGDAAASFARGAWHPGIVFNRASLVSNDSRFSAVSERAVVQRYLDAARGALLRSLTENDGDV